MNEILAAIERLRRYEAAEALPHVADCRHCGRPVFLGVAFVHRSGVYCATEGCVLHAMTLGDPFPP